MAHKKRPRRMYLTYTSEARTGEMMTWAQLTLSALALANNPVTVRRLAEELADGARVDQNALQGPVRAALVRLQEVGWARKTSHEVNRPQRYAITAKGRPCVRELCEPAKCSDSRLFIA